MPITLPDSNFIGDRKPGQVAYFYALTNAVFHK